MTDKVIEPKADASGDKLDAIFNLLGDLAVRMDEMEKNLPAPPLVTAADKKRKDDDEEMGHLAAPEKKDDDDEDDMKHRKDAKKKRKDDDDDAMCDDEEEDMKAKDDSGEFEGPAGEIKPDDDDDDEDDMKAKKDEEEEAKYADAQAAADSVYAAFGKSATRPLKGESLLKYRTRLLRGLQGYSDAYKAVKLSAIKDAQLLSIAEKQIFADALAAAKSVSASNGSLIEHVERDAAGRTIRKFSGSMSAWLDDFKVPSMKVARFNTRNVN